jgi:hypothetical protein
MAAECAMDRRRAGTPALAAPDGDPRLCGRSCPTPERPGWSPFGARIAREQCDANAIACRVVVGHPSFRVPRVTIGRRGDRRRVLRASRRIEARAPAVRSGSCPDRAEAEGRLGCTTVAVAAAVAHVSVGHRRSGDHSSSSHGPTVARARKAHLGVRIRRVGCLSPATTRSRAADDNWRSWMSVVSSPSFPRSSHTPELGCCR